MGVPQGQRLLRSSEKLVLNLCCFRDYYLLLLTTEITTYCDHSGFLFLPTASISVTTTATIDSYRFLSWLLPTSTGITIYCDHSGFLFCPPLRPLRPRPLLCLSSQPLPPTPPRQSWPRSPPRLPLSLTPTPPTPPPGSAASPVYVYAFATIYHLYLLLFNHQISPESSPGATTTFTTSPLPPPPPHYHHHNPPLIPQVPLPPVPPLLPTSSFLPPHPQQPLLLLLLLPLPADHHHKHQHHHILP